MNARKSLATILFTLLFFGAVAGDRQVFAQSTTTDNQAVKQEDETNFNIQLYLLIGTNQDVDDAKLPVALEGVVRQLRAALPFKNYRVAVTLINRVENHGRLNLKWIGGPLVAGGAVSATTPSFQEFKVNKVTVVRNLANQQIVRLEGFGFSVRIPIVTTPNAVSSGPLAPMISYENTGLNTDISLREGESVVVGTLNMGPSGDAIILAMSAKSTK